MRRDALVLGHVEWNPEPTTWEWEANFDGLNKKIDELVIKRVLRRSTISSR